MFRPCAGSFADVRMAFLEALVNICQYIHTNSFLVCGLLVFAWVDLASLAPKDLADFGSASLSSVSLFGSKTQQPAGCEGARTSPYLCVVGYTWS